MTDLDKRARELLCSHCEMDAEDHYDEIPVTAAEAESAIRAALTPTIDLEQLGDAVAGLKSLRADFGMIHVRDLSHEVDEVLAMIDAHKGQ